MNPILIKLIIYAAGITPCFYAMKKCKKLWVENYNNAYYRYGRTIKLTSKDIVMAKFTSITSWMGFLVAIMLIIILRAYNEK